MRLVTPSNHYVTEQTFRSHHAALWLDSNFVHRTIRENSMLNSTQDTSRRYKEIYKHGYPPISRALQENVVSVGPTGTWKSGISCENQEGWWAWHADRVDLGCTLTAQTQTHASLTLNNVQPPCPGPSPELPLLRSEARQTERQTRTFLRKYVFFLSKSVCSKKANVE